MPKEVTFDVIDIFMIREGMITEHRNVSDMLGLMQQLDAVPALG